MKTNFIRIPIEEIPYHLLSTEALVFAYIRSFELGSEFIVESFCSLPIPVCIQTEKHIAQTLGIGLPQLRLALKKLQYRHHRGARVSVEVNGRWRKIWCTLPTILQLKAAHLIQPEDEAKIERLLNE